MLLWDTKLCRNTGPGNQIHENDTYCGGEKKKSPPYPECLYGFYYLFIYYYHYYYFDIPAYILGSLGTVLSSSPTLFISCQPLSKRRQYLWQVWDWQTLKLAPSGHRQRQPRSASQKAAWAPKPQLQQSSLLPESFSVCPPVRLQTRTAAAVAPNWTGISLVKGEIWNSVTF